jgi:hypothetical protein
VVATREHLAGGVEDRLLAISPRHTSRAGLAGPVATATRFGAV